MTTGMFSCGGYVEIRDFDLELGIFFTNSRQDTRHLPAHALKKKKTFESYLDCKRNQVPSSGAAGSVDRGG